MSHIGQIIHYCLPEQRVFRDSNEATATLRPVKPCEAQTDHRPRSKALLAPLIHTQISFKLLILSVSSSLEPPFLSVVHRSYIDQTSS
jgi:hypothetical protein